MNFKQKRPFVLASGSPRRKEYFERYQFEFRILKADIEEIIGEDESPIEATIRLGEAKAQAVLGACNSDEIIISADTIVLLDNTVLGKPKNPTDALIMLQKLNGKTHKVISAYTILDAKDLSHFTRTTETEVMFHQVPVNLLE
ncbi:MAG: septum formation inhibitor Maf, partial [Proteobacteria bacterium]|nr:septum formation inhibitor Maf [Pseudomonadota bacterium]